MIEVENRSEDRIRVLLFCNYKNNALYLTGIFKLQGKNMGISERQ
jgi:hypothetical protein